MSKIITPESSLNKVLSQKSKPLKLVPHHTKWQKIWIWSSGLCLFLAFASGFANHQVKEQVLGQIASGLIIASIITAALYQIAFIIPFLNEMKCAEKTISESISSEFNSDIELIQYLSINCLEHHLLFARDSFSQLSLHLKTRVSLLIGAIEKVGIIPLAIASYYAYQKAISTELIKFSEVEVIIGAVIALYLFSIHMISTSQKLDRVVAIYDAALALHKANNTVRNSSSTAF